MLSETILIFYIHTWTVEILRNYKLKKTPNILWHFSQVIIIKKGANKSSKKQKVPKP